MITDAGPTKPQPAPECNLRKWRTNRFFQTAKVQDVKACLEEGADLNVKGMSKRTPLHFAAENGEPAVVQALLAAGADPNARDKNKETPLHLSAQYNENPLVVEALLAAGADPNAQDEGKQTPLHDAAQYNENPMVIEALLAAGADPMARDKWDDTPLDGAESAANITVVEVLRHPTTVRARQLAASSRTRTQKSGGSGGLGALITAATVVGVGTASGASTEAILAGVEAVASSQQAATSRGQQTAAKSSVSTAGSAAGGGSCEIPGYPSPPVGVANLGFSWCPSSVSMQIRSFALQAAGAQCAIATGSSSTPDQIQARRRETRAACDRLAALGVSNCRCPPRLRL